MDFCGVWHARPNSAETKTVFDDFCGVWHAGVVVSKAVAMPGPMGFDSARSADRVVPSERRRVVSVDRREVGVLARVRGPVAGLVLICAGAPEERDERDGGAH